MTTRISPQSKARRWAPLSSYIRYGSILIFCIGLIACTQGRSALRGGLTSKQVNQLPQEVAAAYDLFAIRCSRCHTLSRPLGAAIYEHEHWRTYVNRMRRHPGSGISQNDAEIILVFLRHYADRKAEEAGLRTPEDTENKEATP